MENPLLEYTGLPQFGRIKPEHVVPAVDSVLAANRAYVAQLLAQPNPPTWDGFVAPIEAMETNLRRIWSPVAHLNAVVNSAELREAFNACLPKLSLYATEMGQNAGLYRGYQTVATSTEDLDATQRKVLEYALRGFRLSGVDLPPEQQARFKTINQRLSQISSTFDENILDATNAWTKLITDSQYLDGLPPSALELLQHNARQREQHGWLLTLDIPAYMPVLTYAKNRQLRQEIYTAYVTRASDQGPNAGQWDNTQLIAEILALRHEMAQLLGFANFAELSLFTKMARTPDRVLNFLEDLARRARPQALEEFAELTAFARTKDGLQQLESWDTAYYTEQLRQERYAISKEELRPYFPAPKVIAGVFAIAQRLFDINIRQLAGIETWHPDVTCYEIAAADGALRGQFYLDPYARLHKRGGAWMDGCIDRMRTIDRNIQNPAAYLVCNFSPPLDKQPALLNHEEVLTLLHEFGHGLHHLLTQVEQPAVSGINGVAWDAVELPSQFLENWGWEQEALNLFAGHWETGEPLPTALYERMHKAKNFQSAMQMMRQLEFALFDFKLHQNYDQAQGHRTLETLAAVRNQVSVLIPPAFNRMPHSFSHIFSGGYAAGYYSYKWAELLSADAFSLFEERGLFDSSSGKAFREHILEQGGSADANELFIAFRGREPSIEPLLRHNGIMARA